MQDGHDLTLLQALYIVNKKETINIIVTRRNGQNEFSLEIIDIHCGEVMPYYELAFTANLVPFGRQEGGICSTSWGNDTVNTRSRNFSRTKSLNTLKGALNQRGAVTMSTFLSLAG